MSLTAAHSEVRLSAPDGWVLRLAHRRPERLVVFVHGFGGGPVTTWQRFPQLAAERPWWTSADMLFVSYRSKRDGLTAAAARLREQLPLFFPRLSPDLLDVGSVAVREETVATYKELVLVGHSLGGVIVRRAMCDIAQDWSDRERTEHLPTMLRGTTLALFSPASAGVRPAGMAGVASATPLWWLVNMWLRRSSAVTDLRPDSSVLKGTQRRTEALVREHPELVSLRARILWANPDDVVVAERYDTDRIDRAVDGRTHRSVCKPDDDYDRPLLFVEGVE